METGKYEAIGQRGEACIIVLGNVTLPDGATELAYRLATGAHLRPTDVDGEYRT